MPILLILRVMFLSALLLLAGSMPGFAEDDTRDPGVNVFLRDAEHPRVLRPERESPGTRSRPISRAPFSVPTTDLEKPSPQATQIVTVLGDSMGIQLGQGLREALIANPEIGLVNKARGSTGIVNTSERDWPKYIRELVTSPDKNDLTLILIGSNDNQPLRDEWGIAQEAGSEKWAEIYAKRIDDMLAPLKERKIPVIWVGLPSTKYEKLSARFLAFNRLYRERVQKAGFTYIDIWDAFADEQGRFSASGPDVTGEIVKLRAGDGVHFTKSGFRKLAFFVERDLLKILNPQERNGTIAPIPEDLREQIRLQSEPVPAIRVPSADIRNAVPLPDVATLAPELRKREQGPIAPLTSQPVAAAGVLTQGLPQKLSADPTLKEAARLSDEVFVAGKAQYPKPNRGDDFGWPRR